MLFNQLMSYRHNASNVGHVEIKGLVINIVFEIVFDRVGCLDHSGCLGNKLWCVGRERETADTIFIIIIITRNELALLAHSF